MKVIDAEQINESCFKLIGKDWMLVTAEKKDGTVNTMTASWGGLGVLWGKKVAFVFIRPQRYTKEFVDESKQLSLNFFTEDYRDTLTYMGKNSGRDGDKISHCKLTVDHEGDIPYFKEAKLSVMGKVLYTQDMKPELFEDKSLVEKWYQNNDFHKVYVVEIEQTLVK